MKEQTPVSMVETTWGRRYTIGGVVPESVVLPPAEAEDIIKRFNHDMAIHAPLVKDKEPIQISSQRLSVIRKDCKRRL